MYKIVRLSAHGIPNISHHMHTPRETGKTRDIRKNENRDATTFGSYGWLAFGHRAIGRPLWEGGLKKLFQPKYFDPLKCCGMKYIHSFWKFWLFPNVFSSPENISKYKHTKRVPKQNPWVCLPESSLMNMLGTFPKQPDVKTKLQHHNLSDLVAN